MDRFHLLRKFKFRVMLLGLVLLVPAWSQAAEVSQFGPETFVRGSGSPVTVTNTFSVPLQRDGIIRIQNSLEDDPVTSEFVSSSIITLNGTNVVTPESFNQTVTGLEIPVSLLAGDNTLSVEVRGKTGTGLVVETFAFDEAPVAAFATTPTPATGPVPLTVSFDASASTDPDITNPATTDILTYAWNFGDGATGTGITASHVYATPGTFTATLTVTDAFGLTGTATANIEVINTPPVAAIFSGPTSSLIPFTAFFDAFTSTDAENNIATYDWDFGDGATGTGVTTTHEYTSGGVFTVTLTVTDAFGLSSQATGTVEALTNLPPTIQINSPAADAFVIQNRPEISVSYSDDKAVDTASLALTANGAALPVDCQLNETFGTCTPTVDLPEGNVTLSATISDFEAATATTSTSFFVDSIPVEVAIISPLDGDITQDGQVTVTGAIGPTVVSVEVNGVPAAITGADFSATVPLREGRNMLIATARNVNNKTGVSSVDVTRDIQKPVVRIDSPRDGFPAVENQITVTGVVNDIVDGGVAPTVKINGIEVPVVNGTFIGLDLELGLGPNIFEAVATDAAGNMGSHSITVNFQPPAGPKLVLSSGNGQQAQVGTELAEPLTVQVVDGEGLPVAGRTVRFEVTRNNGILSGEGMVFSDRIIGVVTDGNGEARVNLTLGSTAGGGNNRVKVTSTGVAGEIEFCATGLPNPPDKLIANMGDNQRGPIGEPLPIPLEALLQDAQGNPVEGVDVTFNIFRGGGNFNGQVSNVVTTGSDGIARAVFNLGFEPGINNNVATATFPGLTTQVPTFTASGLLAGDPANTTFSGVVLDSAQTPIPGATVIIEGTTVTGTTDDEGQFLLTGVPVGAFVLKVDPANSPRLETFPPLEFEIVTISGVENVLGMPIILPQIDTDMAKLVGGNEDVVLEMKGVPGVKLTILANSATFPDGSKTGMASVSQVHMDQVPMQPPNGSIPPLAGTLQPLGAKFDPPVRVQFPNINGLPPGTVSEMFQFHHDTSRFVPIGKGTVTEDGRFIISDPGFGLPTGGWHLIAAIFILTSSTSQCGECEQSNGAGGCEAKPFLDPATGKPFTCDAGNACTQGECNNRKCEGRKPLNVSQGSADDKVAWQKLLDECNVKSKSQVSSLCQNSNFGNVSFDVGRNQPGVQGDSHISNKVDLADLEVLDNSGCSWSSDSCQAIIHIIQERLSLASGKPFGTTANPGAHADGNAEETKYRATRKFNDTLIKKTFCFIRRSVIDPITGQLRILEADICNEYDTDGNLATTERKEIIATTNDFDDFNDVRCVP